MNIRNILQKKNLDTIINNALEEAERLWKENPNIKTIVYGGGMSFNGRYGVDEVVGNDF